MAWLNGRQEFYLDGNKGGDYIKLRQNVWQHDYDCVDIEVGHCCVVVLKAQVPVEFLTSLICKFMLTGPDGFSRSTEDKLSTFAREVMEFNKEFTDERLSKIKEWG